MLEVKILKTTHAFLEEAAKLLPYIGECHVYSPEHAACTEEFAQLLEADWEMVLKSGWNLATFESMNRSAARTSLSHLPKVQVDYVMKERVYLFVNKIPFFHVERFNAETAQELNNRKFEESLVFKKSLELLLKRKFDDFFQSFEQYLKIGSNLNEIRDREIARNIDNAEQTIVRRYQQLAGKNPLIYTINIGANHQPEKYISSRVEVVDLRRDQRTISEKLDYALSEGNTFEEIKNLSLRYGIFILASKRKISVTEQEVEATPDENLLSLIK